MFGLLIGALPGLGPMFAVALMLPMTFNLPEFVTDATTHPGWPGRAGQEVGPTGAGLGLCPIPA